MGLTSAMNTGATGLDTSQIMLETIGDNIANVNTTAFKSNRADFESLFYLTLKEGVGPGNGLGGINPSQVGLGATLGAIQRSFVQGAISPTGAPTDLAIEGQGFFVLEDGAADRFYTRDGAFSLDVTQQLVSRDGLFVQGFVADADGNIDITGAPSALTIPLGVLTQVRATTTASVGGNLAADVNLATAGSVITSAPLITAGGAAAETTPLTALVGESGLALFADGDVVEVGNVSKGGFELTTEQFVVGTDGSTVQDLMTFLEGALAINTDPVLAETAGVTLEAGSIVVSSNLGEANAIEIDGTDIRNVTAGIAPFSFTSTAEAVGQGVTTSFLGYDSLGDEVTVRLRMVKVLEGDLGTTWRWYAESETDTDVSNVLGAGTISFDQDGRFTGATDTTVSIDLADTGAADPLTMTLDFSGLTGLASGAGSSEVTLTDQDGRPFGTLVDFGIDEEGIITGAFSNGLSSTLGQVALATFTNVNGLSLHTENNYLVTDNSGDANITVPKQSNAGRVESGALEMSNVDLAREFIGLINASTGFSANSRVITTADELLQELLLIAR